MKRVIFLLVLGACALHAQEILSDRILGLRVTGSAEAQLPVAGLNNNPITIEFDLRENIPPSIVVKFFHCDRNWNVTQNSFINDEMRNRTKFPLSFEPAPAGVQQYRFHYTLKVPGFAGVERFPQSGNYIFEIWDDEAKTLLGRGRFFVVENTIKPGMSVTNRSLPSEANPYSQVNKIEVGFAIPGSDGERKETLFPIYFTTLDIYKNRQLYTPWRIDADDKNPNTFIDGFGTMKLKFIIDNLPPGNEYRRIDLRDINLYPLGQQLRAKDGADVSRFLFKSARDNNGLSVFSTGNRYADYLKFQFELLVDGNADDSVFVVGDFNGWKPSPQSLMRFDTEKNRFVWSTSLRRGIYDYQYVRANNDWISIEGNDWRTINVYTAFIYYHDTRLGGFDRILGYAQRSSPGGVEATSQ